MPEHPREITIAIDGYSSCGKSTLARDLADHLGYLHIDSGAMYRATALYFLRHNIDLHDAAAVEQAIGDIHITFDRSGGIVKTILNHEDVELDIRSLAVNQLVSPVAAISFVRRAMVALQRQLGAGNGVVMDGRDIGTVVFPAAHLKLFLTADLDVRIERRYKELINKGFDVNRKQVSLSLTERDQIDSTREDSPLRQASDAVVIDNTSLSREDQLKVAIDLAMTLIAGP